ncbi:MAG TPA: hypothetical protein IAA44_02760 [Candidatus Blautia avistercoris]|nr:hypothetical protein [Candidatus Blautia avistercoris]
MKKRTELVFIIDRSGSMCGLETDTIGGFNGMLEKQKKEPGEAFVTTVLFDDQYERIHQRVPIHKVQPLTAREYYVRGCTALLDAVGRTIQYMISVQRNLEEEERADQVIFVITTDGYENASREYTYSRIQKMITHEKEKYGWEFLFLGANMDAEMEAGKFGIGRDRAVTYCNDSQGVQANYEAMTVAVSQMRCSSAPVGSQWKSAVEKDREKRRKKERKIFGKFRE